MPLSKLIVQSEILFGENNEKNNGRWMEQNHIFKTMYLSIKVSNREELDWAQLSNYKMPKAMEWGVLIIEQLVNI